MTRFLWYLRQIIPTKYRSTFKEDGFRYRCDWWMWLGRSFGIRQELIEGTMALAQTYRGGTNG